MSTKHSPISVFALQTPDQRDRAQRLDEAMADADWEEVEAACERRGLHAREEKEPEQEPERESKPRHAGPAHAAPQPKRAKGAASDPKPWLLAAAVALVLLAGIGIGYAVGSHMGPDLAPVASQDESASEGQAATDEAARDANVRKRYEAMRLDEAEVDRVSLDDVEPITVDAVAVQPADELARIAGVDVSAGTSVKLDVPVVNQLDTSDGGEYLMAGCEIASLAMLLQHAGVDVTKEELMADLPIVPFTGEDGLYGNPNKAFVGDMHGTYGEPGYSVYHTPIAELAQHYLLNGRYRVVDLTGQSFTAMLREVADGNPCWVITTDSFEPTMLAETWETAEGPMTINWTLHSVVVTGFDDENIYINDPYGYAQNVAHDRDAFEESWKLMGSQCVTVVPHYADGSSSSAKQPDTSTSSKAQASSAKEAPAKEAPAKGSSSKGSAAD